MRTDRRTFIATTAAAAVHRLARASDRPIFRPEEFGALGDGATNDTSAFQTMSRAIYGAGGGTILFTPRRTYLVGGHTSAGPWAWNPVPIIKVHHLTRPLRILGQGARLLCEPGLRYGTFNKATGAPLHRAMPNLRQDDIATPYRAMIWVHDCLAPVEVSDIELDGNDKQLLLGGKYGDAGWQIPASGLWLIENRGEELVSNVHSHHHPLDGAMIDGVVHRTARSRFSRLISRYNGRQGISIVAGHGYDFDDCDFSYTGRSALVSAPGAGVDIEAENNKTNRDLTFTRCTFVDNVGLGMGADTGDSAGATFTDCRFVGTTSFAAWPRKPNFSFQHCTFVGAVVQAFYDKENASRATRFTDCRFTDDPALSPSGKVYLGSPSGGAIVDLGASDNVVFTRCSFDCRDKGRLPWSWRATYADCTMTQRSKVPAMTKGKYLGRTTINGPVELYGSMILGTVILNGRVVPRGPVGSDFPPW